MVAVMGLQAAKGAHAADARAIQRRVGQVIEGVEQLVAEEVADGAQQEHAGQARPAQQPASTMIGDASTNRPSIVYQGIMMRPSSRAGRSPCGRR